jgi:hypothetical protein
MLKDIVHQKRRWANSGINGSLIVQVQIFVLNLKGQFQLLTNTKITFDESISGCCKYL